MDMVDAKLRSWWRSALCLETHVTYSDLTRRDGTSPRLSRSSMIENESTFVAPEGVYSVTEDFKPSPIPAHTGNNAHIYPTKLSAVVIHFPAPKPAAPGFAQLLGGNKESKKEREKDREREKERLGPKLDREDGASLSSSDTPEDGSADQSTPAPEGILNNSSIPKLFSQSQVASKKKSASRPKHNIRTTSSTFVTRLQSAEGLSKLLQSKHGETTFLFYNLAKTLYWVETGSKSKEPLARVSFSAYPTCHDVNTSTASSERIDVVIGFHTGDLIWFDPISSRYNRLNKSGSISNSCCTAVRWVPSSSSLFLVSHADGTIIVYDKERDDGVFVPQDPSQSPDIEASSNPSPTSQDNFPSTQRIDWDPLNRIFVTTPPWHPSTSGVGSSNTGSKGEKEKIAKNPVSHWRVSRRSVVDLVFSPDVKYVAAISEDGCLRVIDALAEQLVDCYASYFGSLTSVAWSPDGRFILTGGQDDLLTIFSPWEQRVVARCQGHSSFVASVVFDDLRCDGRTYRFGSVGEDNKLVLWDFSSGALHRPKQQASHHHHHRMSMSSSISLSFRRERSTMYLPANDGSGVPLPRYHPAPSRTEISVVQPVLVKSLESDLLTGITFLPRSVITYTKNGNIKVWIRPLATRSRRVKSGQAIDLRGLIS